MNINTYSYAPHCLRIRDSVPVFLSENSESWIVGSHGAYNYLAAHLSWGFLPRRPSQSWLAGSAELPDLPRCPTFRLRSPRCCCCCCCSWCCCYLTRSCFIKIRSICNNLVQTRCCCCYFTRSCFITIRAICNNLVQTTQAQLSFPADWVCFVTLVEQARAR